MDIVQIGATSIADDHHRQNQNHNADRIVGDSVQRFRRRHCAQRYPDDHEDRLRQAKRHMHGPAGSDAAATARIAPDSHPAGSPARPSAKPPAAAMASVSPNRRPRDRNSGEIRKDTAVDRCGVPVIFAAAKGADQCCASLVSSNHALCRGRVPQLKQ
jgi:hypothetical protein